jgi:hypothetical protein
MIRSSSLALVLLIACSSPDDSVLVGTNEDALSAPSTNPGPDGTTTLYNACTRGADSCKGQQAGSSCGQGYNCKSLGAGVCACVDDPTVAVTCRAGADTCRGQQVGSGCGVGDHCRDLGTGICACL